MSLVIVVSRYWLRKTRINHLDPYNLMINETLLSDAEGARLDLMERIIRVIMFTCKTKLAFSRYPNHPADQK